MDRNTVYVKDVSGKGDWLPGVIIKVQGPLTYLVELEDELRVSIDDSNEQSDMIEAKNSETPPNIITDPELPP